MKLLHLIHHLSRAPQLVVLPCPVPIGAGRVIPGQALTSSSSRMSFPFSWGLAQRAGTAGESQSSAKLGLAVAQDLEFGPEKADFGVFFVPGQGKALSSLRSCCIGGVAVRRLPVSGAKREAEASGSRCSAAATGSHPRRQRASAGGRPPGISQQTPTRLALAPAKKQHCSCRRALAAPHSLASAVLRVRAAVDSRMSRRGCAPPLPPHGV